MPRKPRNAFTLAPRMASLALTFAAPAAAFDLLEQVERSLPDERPGAVSRGFDGVIDPDEGLQLHPELDVFFQGGFDATPEYWPVQTTRYRIASVTAGECWNRPEDRFGMIGGFSRTSETRFGPSLEEEYAIGGYYGWQLAPNMTVQGDIQYLMPGPTTDDRDQGGLMSGLNLRIEF